MWRKSRLFQKRRRIRQIISKSSWRITLCCLEMNFCPILTPDKSWNSLPQIASCVKNFKKVLIRLIGFLGPKLIGLCTKQTLRFQNIRGEKWSNLLTMSIFSIRNTETMLINTIKMTRIRISLGNKLKNHKRTTRMINTKFTVQS